MAPPNRVLRLRQPGQALSSRTQDATAAVLEPVAQQLGATPIMGAPPPSWVKPDIISSSGFAQGPSIAATPLPTTSFHKDALGYVHGKVNLITAAGVAGNVVAFNIAQGSRPGDLLPFLMSDGGGVVSEVTIGPDGNFTVVPAVGAGGLVVGTFTYLAEK